MVCASAIRIFPRLKQFTVPAILKSPYADLEWTKEPVNVPSEVTPSYESYRGQQSTVINYINWPVPHSSVNPYVAEEISRNKFYQYLLMKDTAFEDLIIPSALVGLGANDSKMIETLLERHSSFVLKPITGQQGRGIKKLSRQEIEDFLPPRGPVRPLTFLEKIAILGGSAIPPLNYIEDYVDNWNFSFVDGMSLLQPFIDTSQDEKEECGCVRAIVCNGKFVDAYLRLSNDSTVNLSKGARATHFEYDFSFTTLCEELVSTFLSESSHYQTRLFQWQFWTAYFLTRGRRNVEQRDMDIKLLALEELLK